MLSITMKNGKEYTWHVGNSIPVPYKETHNIQEIQADGHELDKIVNLFVADFKVVIIPSIPLAKNERVQRWFGDIAATIVSSLY